MSKLTQALGILLLAGASYNASASTTCEDLPRHAVLTSALQAAVAEENGGLGFNMWATVVNRYGDVCAVTRSGALGEQWPGSRVISAQKANTANAFSLPGLALSTANLFATVQDKNSLFGLQHSNPVDPYVAYKGPAYRFGTPRDPMVGNAIGGVNVFGGGLALYNETGKLVGAVGVSGDTSCADHNIAWRVRDILDMDYIPGGVKADGTDNIIFNGAADDSFGHANCLAPNGISNEDANAAVLADHPIGVVAE